MRPSIMTEDDLYVTGRKVHARKPYKTVGVTTGSARDCQMEGCNGMCLGVKWAGRKFQTWPCSRGMELIKGEWYIQ